MARNRKKRCQPIKISPLLKALRAGNTKNIYQLLQPSPDRRFHLNRTEKAWVKRYCFENDDSDLLMSLVSRQVNLNTTKADLFIRALREQKSNLINSFLSDPDVDLNSLKPEYKRSALFYTRSPELAEVLVKEKGVDVNILDVNGESVLVAATRLRATPFVEFLLKNGAKVNSGEEKGKTTPLLEAAKLFEDRIFYCLLQYGANMNYVTPDGRTPLLTSRNHSHIEALLNRGLDVKSVASAVGLTTPIFLLRRIKIGINPHYYRYFLQNSRGPGINARDTDGKTILMFAMERGNLEMVKWAVTAGAKVNLRDGKGESVLKSLFKNTAHFFNNKTDPEWGYKYMYDEDFYSLLLYYNEDWGRHYSGRTVGPQRQLTYKFLHVLISGGGITQYSLNLNLALADFIQDRQLKTIRTVLINGAAPAVVKNFQVRIAVDGEHHAPLRCVSPLFVAFAFYNRQVIDTLVNGWFFTRFDLWIVSSSPSLLTIMDRIFCQLYVPAGDLPSVYFRHLFSQPLTLLKLCFVMVSDLIGPGDDRKQRVEATGLPKVLQNMLMFRQMAIAHRNLARIR